MGGSAGALRAQAPTARARVCPRTAIWSLSQLQLRARHTRVAPQPTCSFWALRAPFRSGRHTELCGGHWGGGSCPEPLTSPRQGQQTASTPSSRHQTHARSQAAPHSHTCPCHTHTHSHTRMLLASCAHSVTLTYSHTGCRKRSQAHMPYPINVIPWRIGKWEANSRDARETTHQVRPLRPWRSSREAQTPPSQPQPRPPLPRLGSLS